MYYESGRKLSMGKTYFSLSDNLNFNGKTIKIKANSTEPPIKEEKKGRAYFNADFQSRIYQSILASQPQLVQVKSDSIIRMETDLRFLNSSAQVGRIEIEMGENGGYVVKTNVALNKVTTGAAHVGSAQVEEKEWIVVSGMQLKGFKYQFIETALHDIDNLIIEGVDPANITWIVFVHDYVYIPRDHDRERFSKTAENLEIKIQFIENRTEFIHYINTKTLDGSETLREKTKIKYLSVFAHGQTPKFTGGDETQLSFAYDFNNDEKNRKKINWEGIINFRMSEIEELEEKAFCSDVVTRFYTCNTGTADTKGERFAQEWVDQVGGVAYAFQNARSNYIFMNSTMDVINLKFNLPGSFLDKAVSDVINGEREKKHGEWDEISTELITSIIGENHRETAKYIAENIIIYPVSEEWKIKKQRKKDRDRVDENGIRYGYSDKGCLQYPMINDPFDDWQIILGTWPEKRGFLKYERTHGGGGRKF